jgi:tetratricopeptide (TPR) repeat protein
MWLRLIIISTLLLLNAAVGTAEDSRRPNFDPKVSKILVEAFELGAQQPDHQGYWIDRLLLDIGHVQIRAGDFDGALRSIRRSHYHYGRNAGLSHLAEAIARNGDLERGFTVLAELDNHGWSQDALDDHVQLNWIEYLLESGDLNGTRKSFERLKLAKSRNQVRWKLAAAAFKANADPGTVDIALSVEPDHGYSYVTTLCEIAAGQLALGKVELAKGTLRHLTETAVIADPFSKVASLRECAVLTAKIGEATTARQLFDRAISAQKDVDELNKINVLGSIAKSQAAAGFFDDALKTVALIEQSTTEDSSNSYHDQALLAVAVGQFKATNVEAALETAKLIKSYPQYQDDAFQQMAELLMADRKLAAALEMSERITNPSKKAVTNLRIALAHAKSNDRKAATEIAARITLAGNGHSIFDSKEPFDYRLPRRWGVRFEPSVTMASHLSSIRTAASVASAAMFLSLQLQLRPEEPYEILFKDFDADVIRALARAHADSGKADEALVWALRIGSDGKVASENDRTKVWSIERRICALIGVAEGILDSTTSQTRK